MPSRIRNGAWIDPDIDEKVIGELPDVPGQGRTPGEVLQEAG
jgi:hypothetical protein